MSGVNRTFVLPSGTTEQQLAHCLNVIAAQRTEILPLRKTLKSCRLQAAIWEKSTERWREKYEQAEEELKQLRKKNELLEQEKEQLKKEKGKLEKEIEKISKTNVRYQIALFDHGNFKQPQVSKKAKGGQWGHADTNREKTEDYSSFKKKRIFAQYCGNCSHPLSRVDSSKKRILMDIVLHPEMIKMIICSERQWCGTCKKEVIAKDPQTLPFTEYGMNTFIMTMILRFSCHSSLSNISHVLQVGFGLSLSPSAVANLLQAGASYLDKRYEALKKAIREGKVMYADETGWLVHGQKAWMWIMTTDKETVYVAAESRGGGIAKKMYGESNAYAMTDGLSSYTNIIPKDRHLYCWAHMLRFAFEETAKLKPQHTACQLRDALVTLYQEIRAQTTWTKEKKEATLRKKLADLIVIKSTDQTVANILYRVATQKEGLILALLVTADGTNNLAERELRNMAIKRTISHGSDTYRGMETTAIIGSVMQTLSRNIETPFIPTFKRYLVESIQEKHTQYIHTPYYDS